MANWIITNFVLDTPLILDLCNKLKFKKIIQYFLYIKFKKKFTRPKIPKTILDVVLTMFIHIPLEFLKNI